MVVAVYIASLMLYTSDWMTEREARLMKDPLSAAAFFCMAPSLWLALVKWRGKTGTDDGLDYAGESDPVVRTLGLKPQ
jgi:hypothetical protein